MSANSEPCPSTAQGRACQLSKGHEGAHRHYFDADGRASIFWGDPSPRQKIYWTAEGHE